MSNNYIVSVMKEYVRDTQIMAQGEWVDLKKPLPLMLGTYCAVSLFDAMRLAMKEHNIDNMLILEAHELYDEKYDTAYDVGQFMYDVEDCYQERLWHVVYPEFGDDSEDGEEYFRSQYGSLQRAIRNLKDESRHSSNVIEAIRMNIAYALSETFCRCISENMIFRGYNEEAEGDGEGQFGIQVHEGETWYDAEYTAVWKITDKTSVAFPFALSVNDDFFMNEAEIAETIEQINVLCEAKSLPM